MKRRSARAFAAGLAFLDLSMIVGGAFFARPVGVWMIAIGCVGLSGVVAIVVYYETDPSTPENGDA